MIPRKFTHWALLWAFLACFSLIAADEEKKPDTEAGKEAVKEEPEEKEDVLAHEEAREKRLKRYAQIREVAEKSKGLFPFYQDPHDGTVFLSLSKKHLGREFIYFSHTVDAPVAAGRFRGQFGQEKVFTLKRHFGRIEFVVQNHSFYFDPQNALSRAADANISPAVVASAEIIAHDEKENELLIEADEIFLGELFAQIKPSSGKKDDNRFQLGDLSKERTKFVDLRNYPENTALTVDYVFQNLHPKKRAEEDVTDSRFVSVVVQHSLIAMPKNNYKPRLDDPRVGFFLTKVNDMTSTSNTPYRDLIHRWHLEAKDPEAEILEPKEPITWWIENTTPVELRDTIRKAALLWNEAFESAGWKNALEVKIQPDDAEWDAGDIRYNVLRWTSSPNPPFGGYGPSFVNPRTGQIIGADIMLEWVFLTNRVRYQKIYGEPAVAADDPRHQCLLGDCLHQGALFGRAAIKLGGSSKIEEDQLMKEALHYLVLHELGHTLGLAHNFKASQLHSPAKLNSEKLTKKMGVTASVMDYPSINVAPQGAEQGQYYTSRPGPYDHWAITFGYSPRLDDPKKMEAHLARSTEPALDFANDSDDMRSPGKAIDPRAMIGDMSSDAIGYGVQRIEKVRALMNGLLTESPESGRSYQTVRDERRSLMREQENHLSAIARYVGGVYVDRAVVGQEGGTQPLTPVSAKDQRRALEALADHAFAPNAFVTDPELLAHLQIQRRGWDLKAEGEDPKLHEEILGLQKSLLDHLLHEHTARRVLNSQLYGNEVDLREILIALANGIFEVDGELETEPGSIRQNLQREYVERLVKIAGLESKSNYPQPAQAEAFRALKLVQLRSAQAPQSAHHALLELRIRKALDVRG